MDKFEIVKKLLFDSDNETKSSSNSDTFLEVGAQYLIRTVTMIYSGRVKEVRGQEVLLTEAAWIADTGRWADNLKSCEFSEVEPYDKEVVVCRGAFLDYTKIDRLPLKQK